MYFFYFFNVGFDTSLSVYFYVGGFGMSVSVFFEVGGFKKPDSVFIDPVIRPEGFSDNSLCNLTFSLAFVPDFYSVSSTL